MKFAKNTVIDHGLAIFTILVWGVTFISTKQLSQSFSAMEILFFRYFIAYIALWVACPKALKVKSLKEELYILGAALSGALVYQYLENLSVTYTNPASVCFITALSPVFTAIFAYFFLREKVNAKLFIGMAICLVGVFLVSFGDSMELETGLLGDVIIFCGVWLWAVYSILVKKIDSFGYSGVLITRRIFFYAIMMMIPCMYLWGGEVSFNQFLEPKNCLNFVYLSLFASVLCYLSWNTALKHIGAMATSAYIYVGPVVTVVLSVIILDEQLTCWSFIGMALTMAGLILSEWLNVRKLLINATEN